MLLCDYVVNGVRNSGTSKLIMLKKLQHSLFRIDIKKFIDAISFLNSQKKLWESQINYFK